MQLFCCYFESKQDHKALTHCWLVGKKVWSGTCSWKGREIYVWARVLIFLKTCHVVKLLWCQTSLLLRRSLDLDLLGTGVSFEKAAKGLRVCQDWPESGPLLGASGHLVLEYLKNTKVIIRLGTSCSTAVEHSSHNWEVINLIISLVMSLSFNHIQFNRTILFKQTPHRSTPIMIFHRKMYSLESNKLSKQRWVNVMAYCAFTLRLPILLDLVSWCRYGSSEWC